MKNVELLTFSTADDLARAAAGAWLDEIEAANRAGQQHCVALSGGRITQKFFAATVELAKAREVSFANVHFFWADERCVPPTDPESNFKMADELLFQPLNMAAENIHRLHGELPVEVATKMANEEIEQLFSVRLTNSLRAFDLILLGMGEDGHVASLFPKAPVPEHSATFIAVTNSPKPPPTRISLSYPAIFAAKKVWALVSGAGKATALRASLQPEALTPLGIIARSRTVKIFSDTPSA